MPFGAAVIAAVLSASCSDSPTTPSPSPSTDILAIVCPEPITAVANTATGAAVVYQPPVVTGGRPPVTSSCSRPSGQPFPIGTTSVTCSAQDATPVSTSCTFAVTVQTPPRLSATRFLAFGDSITAGEVTAPQSVAMANGERWWPLVVVPTVSYPTRLAERLTAGYPLQQPTVVNAGQSGQSATDGVSRFLATATQPPYDVVLLLMGYNDVSGDSRSVANGAAALERMVRNARGRNLRVFLATLTPTITGRLRSVDQALLDTMNVRIRQIAAAEGAVLVDLHQAFQPAVFTWVGSDGIHPTESGYVRIAETFLAAIRTTLETN